MQFTGKKFKIEKGVTAELVHLGTCDEGLFEYFVLLVPHFETFMDNHMDKLEKIAEGPIIDSDKPTTVYNQQGVMFFFDTDSFFGKGKKQILHDEKNHDKFIQSVSTRIRKAWAEAKQARAASFLANVRNSTGRTVTKKIPE